MRNGSIDMRLFVEHVRSFPVDVECVFEVGSQDAKDAIFFKQEFPAAEVYAIEALEANYDLFKDVEGIVPINAVVTNYDGKTVFYVKDVNGVHSVLDRGAEYGKTTVELPCFTLRTLCDGLGISSVDVMKIDVEGLTYEVLDGMGELLDSVKILHIETESFPFFRGQRLHDEVCEFMFSSGFVLVDAARTKINRHVPDGFQIDSVWLRGKREKK